MSISQSMVVLIPAYKPQQILLDLAITLVSANFAVVVVDDGSGDEFGHVFACLSPTADLLIHPINRGKGAALKTGLAHIQNHYPNAKVIITADADGQHLPEDIFKVRDTLLGLQQGMVIGSRLLRGNIPFKSRFGNTLTRWLFVAATRVMAHDTQSGLRAFKPDEIPFLLSVPGNRYEYELNVLMWATRRGIPLLEVPIQTVYEPGNPTSHFHVIRDSYQIYAQLFKFGCSSFSSFLVDYFALLTLRWMLFGLGPSVSLLTSSVVARLLSSSFNYWVNRTWVFHSKGTLRRTGLSYFLLVFCLWGANFCLLYLAHIVVGIPLWLSKLGVDMTLFIASYNIQKKYIFSPHLNG